MLMKHPFKINNKIFMDNYHEHYKWLRDNAPVYKGKYGPMSMYFVSRYEDVQMVLKDGRFLRNRNKARGKSFLFPLPKVVRTVTNSLILKDGSDHRRLRSLVHKAFTPRVVSQLQDKIETLTHELLDNMDQGSNQMDLLHSYALPIPVKVIADLVGIPDGHRDAFLKYSTEMIQKKPSFFNIFKIFGLIQKVFDLTREVIKIRRNDPQEDLMTGLIEAEEQGEKLSEDELVSMIYLLVVAGYETTVHLIGNAVHTLLQHPDQLKLLREEPELIDSAIEEVMRYNSPIHGTKLHFPTEDITLHGVTIPRGKMILALIGSANHDERKFENPDCFDIKRQKNQHFGFGGGIHYCLGAPLARLESKIALRNLLQRYPNLQLDESKEIKKQFLPLWNRLENLPIRLQ